MCCHSLRPREANIFHVLPVEVAVSVFKGTLLLKKHFLEKELMKTKETAISAET
jgi:hypothetical protein